MLGNLSRPNILHIRDDRFQQLVDDVRDSSVSKEAALSKALGGDIIRAIKKIFGFNSYKAADHLYDLLKKQEKLRGPDLTDDEVRKLRDSSLELLKELRGLAEPEYEDIFQPEIIWDSYGGNYSYQIDLSRIVDSELSSEEAPDHADSTQITIPVFSSSTAQKIWNENSRGTVHGRDMRSLDRIFEPGSFQENLKRLAALPDSLRDQIKIDVTDRENKLTKFNVSLGDKAIGIGALSPHDFYHALNAHTGMRALVTNTRGDEAQRKIFKSHLKEGKNLEQAMEQFAAAKKIDRDDKRYEKLYDIANKFLKQDENSYVIDSLRCTIIKRGKDTDT